ncbi:MULTISPECIES: alpha/beta hydrolase-fold protein [unclassified Imperialibacter]|uniref:alpha/beta hydrolase-fold protein n=2 Tax=Imperialibacter TaxID=1649461 RepID=UPI00125F625B|nr:MULTISPECIES: alpha/beta hydrolase-fold protein [unclassified Imperialibacter]
MRFTIPGTMFKALTLAAISFLSIIKLQAQVSTTENIVGANHSIASKILGEERQIQVYLPDGYGEEEKRYPVIFILDGQRFFLHTVGLAATFKQYQLAPEFIVVGITNSYPQRFNHFADGKQQFAEFIEKELIPYVESSYRTSGERLLFGWEYAGSFAFHILTNHPSLFDGYMLASPFPLLDKVDVLDKLPALNKSLYFSVSPNEFEVNRGVDKLDSLLSEKDLPGLNWTCFRLENEEHRSTGYSTLYHGLRKYFGYYPELQVDDLQAFVEAGGMAYAHSYTKERASRYGFSPDMSLWSRFTIVRSALRARDYTRFRELYEALGSAMLISDLIEGGRSYGAFSIADFLIENGKHRQAIDIYLALLKQSPDSADLLSKLAGAYQALGNQGEAKKYLQKLKKLQQQK